jgi:hypothetical protein
MTSPETPAQAISRRIDYEKATCARERDRIMETLAADWFWSSGVMEVFNLALDEILRRGLVPATDKDILDTLHCAQGRAERRTTPLDRARARDG